MSYATEAGGFPSLAEEAAIREHYLNANANVKRKPYGYELSLIIGCEEDVIERVLVANRLNGFLLVGFPELCRVRSRRWRKLLNFISAFPRSVRREMVLPVSALYLICDEADPRSAFRIAPSLVDVSAIVSTYRHVYSGEFRIWLEGDLPPVCIRESVSALYRGAFAAGIHTEAERNFELFSRLPGLRPSR